jgi:hypothetical protein
MHISSITTPHHPSTPMLDEAALCAWVGAASPGDCLQYWRGFLAIDAGTAQSQLEATDRRVLGNVARRAWRLAEQGCVHLLQRRHGNGDYAYLLVLRPQPRSSRRTRMHRSHPHILETI